MAPREEKAFCPFDCVFPGQPDISICVAEVAGRTRTIFIEELTKVFGGKTVAEINKFMHKFWDLDMLGIRVEDEIHKSVVSNISFTGERFSVGLPWKMGWIIVEQENAGIIKKLADTNTSSTVSYLPHRAVVRN